MEKTSHHEYLGWDISISCIELPRAIDEAHHDPSYTASAIATLMPSESPDSWVDPRAQMVTLGNRSFLNDLRCTVALLVELQELIDALKK